MYIITWKKSFSFSFSHLDIIYWRKIKPQEFKEITLFWRQVLVCQKLQQVTKVIPTAKEEKIICFSSYLFVKHVARQKTNEYKYWIYGTLITSAWFHKVKVNKQVSRTLRMFKNTKISFRNLWKDSIFMLSKSTMPEVIRSSAKLTGSMPSSSCFLNWRPEFWRRSILSWAYMSSLPSKKTFP